MGFTRKGHISNISTIVVSVVLDVLGAPVRQEDVVGSFNIPIPIMSFSLVEVGARVIVMDSILIAVGFGFFLVDRAMVGGWGVVHWSMHWGVDGSVDGSVDGAGGVGS